MKKEIVTGGFFNIKCSEHNCKHTLKLQCIFASTMESMVVKNKKYFDLRNTQWKCIIHALRTRKKNYHRKTIL